jgi:ring-1,2-phenylacetyl-CoA epoxidase subunit PaaD
MTVEKQTLNTIWKLLDSVMDPEVPVISIVDLGIVREVRMSGNEVVVTITPTYSGCPAMDYIENDIRQTLAKEGFDQVKIETVLSPPWTTDWLSESARVKLKNFGIAPPEGSVDKSSLLAEAKDIQCPLCNSRKTEMISQFGSTACKALYKCLDCLEPFDYFKCI